MSDELDLDFDNEGSQVDINRLKQLSNKVKLTAQERDEIAEAKRKVEDEKAKVEKERDFYASFSDAIAQYPQAKDHKDEIKDKVMAGYDPQDATVAVLARAGKLTTETKVEAKETESSAGGSAANNPKSLAPKGLDEMSREDKRKALEEILG